MLDSTEIISSKTNRNPVKNFFITIPKSLKLTKTDLQSRLPPYDYVLICQELHKDGEPHLHALVSLKKKLSKSKMLHYLQKKLPEFSRRLDVGVVKSLRNSIDYVKKEDPDVLEDGAVKLPNKPFYNEQELIEKKREKRYKTRRKCLPESHWENLMKVAREEDWFKNIL